MRHTTPSTAATTATTTPEGEESAQVESGRGAVLRQLRPAILLTLLLTLIAGVLYPLATTGAAQALFPSQANGSLVYANGKLVGSRLIGQYWTQPQYFHGRPSATLNLQGTPTPYEADNSGGSNLGPTNSALIQTVQQRIDELKKENPDVPAGTPIPVDLVTASASGLDPDISVAAAYYQIPRIAKARGLSQEAVRQLVDAHITGRFLGLFGEPRVNVLELNLALDELGHS
ncbi:MAG: potassium-transporting ATPase C chain [Ktedonobacterales bacterium]|nr:MAG: potassium-transporting ATPase C chain [Ktedonobacterales bacterium]